jgi:WD40 repeat protein
LFEPSGALLTNGSAGLLRWPVQTEPTKPGLLRMGPPHKLSVPGPICHVACSADGRVIALSQFQGGRVLHADRPDQPVRLEPHDDARYVAVSPDGRWVATGSHTRTAVKIWESRTGKLVKELPADGSRVGFSPDGKWLATTAGGLRLWAVGSWQEGHQIGGWANAFSPDGKLLAAVEHGVVQLINPTTGREFARLEDPNQDRPRLFDLAVKKPEPLFDSVVEIDELSGHRRRAVESLPPSDYHAQMSESPELDSRRA